MSVTHLGGNPDVLALDHALLEQLGEGAANALLVAIHGSLIDVPVAHAQRLLHYRADLVSLWQETRFSWTKLLSLNDAP